MNSVTSPRHTKVLFVAQGDIRLASSRWRVFWWLPHLERAGYECRVIPMIPERYEACENNLRRSLRRLIYEWKAHQQIRRLTSWADCIVIQEALLPSWLLHHFRKQRKHVIYDFSDPMHLASSPAHGWRHKLWKFFVGRRRFTLTLSVARFGVIENDLLAEVVARYGAEPIIMRGPLNVEAYAPCFRPPNGKVVLGWIGTPGTSAYVAPILPVLKELMFRYPNLIVRLIGYSSKVALDGVAAEVIPWFLETECREVPRFDIGLAPLPASEWSRFKGGGKVLLYMACGVPVVSSPFGISDQVIRAGEVGFLANGLTEWRDCLVKLIDDPGLRRRLGQEGRRQAVERYSYSAYLPLFQRLLRGEGPCASATESAVGNV